MPYSFTLTATIPASSQEIYDAWLDSLAHSKMTGGEASMSNEIGAEVSAWDGYISGRNLELVPGERIVQSWRTSEFSDEHQDSMVTVTFEEINGGTLMTLEHSNVPNEHKSYEEGGWQSNYFEPMLAYFGERKQRATRTSAEKAGPKTAPKRAAKSARRAKEAKGARGTKGARPKRAAPRKASPRKGKRVSARRHAAAASGERTRATKRKSRRAKRK